MEPKVQSPCSDPSGQGHSESSLQGAVAHLLSGFLSSIAILAISTLTVTDSVLTLFMACRQ